LNRLATWHSDRSYPSTYLTPSQRKDLALLHQKEEVKHLKELLEEKEKKEEATRAELVREKEEV
jgi:hypothetical protein